MHQRERTTLTVLGLLALLGLSILLWQRQHPPLMISGQPSPAQAASWDQALARAKRIDINTAGAAELERLPEVGPALAERIVAYRSQHGRFERAEELMQVRGIGPKKYRAIEQDITVR